MSDRGEYRKSLGLPKEYGQTREVWECPQCAFAFDATHTNSDGTYSCPNCAETTLRFALREMIDWSAAYHGNPGFDNVREAAKALVGDGNGHERAKAKV